MCRWAATIGSTDVRAAAGLGPPLDLAAAGVLRVANPRARATTRKQPRMLELDSDSHVHTAFSAGRDSVPLLVAAAEKARLSELTLADQAGPETPWLPAYLAAIQRAQQRTDLLLRAGIEVEAVARDGWLAFPTDLTGIQVVSVAIGALPMPAGLSDPLTVRGLVHAGVLSVTDVVEMLVTVTVKALDRMGRYAPTRLARPLEFLTRMGLTDDEIDESAALELAAACRRTGTVVEVSERHRSPSPRLTKVFAAAGVRLAAASDALQAREVGRWRYVEQVAQELTPVTDAVAG
jgi:histidinol phosphatase-like PHP family hydrolase